jgi:hypothetical protein
MSRRPGTTRLAFSSMSDDMAAGDRAGRKEGIDGVGEGVSEA